MRNGSHSHRNEERPMDKKELEFVAKFLNLSFIGNTIEQLEEDFEVDLKCLENLSQRDRCAFETQIVDAFMCLLENNGVLKC